MPQAGLQLGVEPGAACDNMAPPSQFLCRRSPDPDRTDTTDRTAPPGSPPIGAHAAPAPSLWVAAGVGPSRAAVASTYAWTMKRSRKLPPRDGTASGFEPVYSGAIALGRALFGFWRLRVTTVGLSNIPDTGGAVVAMTHFGYFEFALVEWMTWRHNRRRIRFMAKKEAFASPVIGALLRSMRHIRVDRQAGAAAYADAVAALQRGELIGVFPEAGVSASMTVRELKSGAARLAAEAGVPLIPVSIWGGQRLMTKGHSTRFFERFGVPVSFTFGEPIAVAADADIGAVTAVLRSTLQGMVDREQDEYPVDGTGQWWHPRNRGGTAPTPEEAAIAEQQRRRRKSSS